MPPESSPWDRRDFVSRERRHDALGSRGVGGYSTPRWRDSCYASRGFPRDSSRRHPSGYSRPDWGYHQHYPEDTGVYGCPPSRSDGFWLKDENFRPSGGYGGRYISRESRESYRRSPYRGSSNDFLKHQQKHFSPNGLRSVAVQITPASQTSSKDGNSKNDSAIDGSGKDSVFNHEQSSASISWRPLRWSSTITDRSGPEDAVLMDSEVPDKENQIQSTVASPQADDEGSSTKKPRIGWGQGLAKYEKQKVQGSPDSPGTDAKDNLAQTNSRVDDYPISSPCMEEKFCTRPINTADASVPELGAQLYSEFSKKLDQLEVNNISSLTSFLADLLQNGDLGLTAVMNKLLLLKGDISKELERTECEIDLLESGFKSSGCDAKNNDDLYSPPLPVSNASDTHLESFDVEKDNISMQVHELAYGVTHLSEPVFLTSNIEEQDAQVKDMETNRIGTVSSNCEKEAFLEVRFCNFNQGKLNECSVAIDDDSLDVLEAEQYLSDDAQERLATMSCRDNIECIETGRNSDCACSHVKETCNLISLIMTSNRDAVKRASQLFSKAFPSDLSQFDSWRSRNISSYRKNDLKVKEKLVIRKHRLKFKERVLILKFRALHHLWKEDLHLLSIRKNRRKSRKRLDLSRMESGFRKQHSFIQSQFTLPAGKLTLPPSQELVDFVSKLLPGSQIRPYKSNLNMPALILDDTERRYTKFITHNGLIEDSLSFEKEKATINPWTQEEIELFKVMLVKFGKDFSRISSTLDHKTVADCVEFYYKNHKSEDFREVKKCLDVRKQWHRLPTSTFLVTSGKKWNPETNAASLDILGAASAIAEKKNYNVKSQKKDAAGYQTYNDYKLFYNSYGSVNRAQMIEVTAHEREYLTASVSADLCRALSSEAMSSCVTSSIDPGEKMNYVTLEQPFSPELTQNVYEEDTCSDEGCNELESNDWTDEEKSVFIRALSMYGKNFARISHFVRTRSLEQCKVFFMKAQKSLGLDVIYKGSDKMDRPVTDANEGSSDSDDACAAGIHSVNCSDQSYSNANPDLSKSVANAIREEFINAGVTSLQDEIDGSSEQDDLQGINLEANEIKIDKQIHAMYDHKLSSEEDNPRIGTSPRNSAAVCSNLPTQLSEVAENLDRERKIGGSCIFAPQTEQSITESVPVGSISHTADGDQQKDSARLYSIDGFKKVVSSRELILPKSRSRKRRRASIDLGANSREPLSLAANLGANEDNLHHGHAVHVCSRPSNFSTFQHQIPLDRLPCLQKEYQNLSLYQDNCPPVQCNSLFHDPTSSSVGNRHVAAWPALNFEDKNKQHQNSVAGNLYQQYMLKKSSLNQAAAWNGVSQSKQLVSKMQNDNLNSCSLSPLSPGRVYLPTSSKGKSEVPLLPCSQHASPETKGQSHQTVDVKLFGEILNPSSLRRSNSSSMSSIIRKDGDLYPSKLKSSHHLVLEDAPISYGFWDGSRIQTGFSSLSEYALMLAKHQGTSPGVSSYSGKDGILGSTAVLADYRQPFMHGKQLDNFTELQKRDWVEIESVFQNSRRAALLGASMVSGGKILVGSHSDTGSAVKMQYTSTAKNVISEVESCNVETQGR